MCNQAAIATKSAIPVAAKKSKAELHHGSTVSAVSSQGGVSPPQAKSGAYGAAPASPAQTALVMAGAKALQARAKKVLTPDADPSEAP